MAAFWNRQGTHEQCAKIFAELRGELAELRSRVGEAERTASEAADTAYRYMKKAEQASRRALAAAESENQGPEIVGMSPATPLAPPLTGARARIMARRMRAAGLAPPEEANGVHP